MLSFLASYDRLFKQCAKTRTLYHPMANNEDKEKEMGDKL